MGILKCRSNMTRLLNRSQGQNESKPRLRFRYVELQEIRTRSLLTSSVVWA